MIVNNIPRIAMGTQPTNVATNSHRLAMKTMAAIHSPKTGKKTKSKQSIAAPKCNNNTAHGIGNTTVPNVSATTTQGKTYPIPLCGKT